MIKKFLYFFIFIFSFFLILLCSCESEEVANLRTGEGTSRTLSKKKSKGTVQNDEVKYPDETIDGSIDEAAISAGDEMLEKKRSARGEITKNSKDAKGDADEKADTGPSDNSKNEGVAKRSQNKTAANNSKEPAVSENEVEVSGTVKRAIGIRDGGDGRGTLCVYITNLCPTRDNLTSIQIFGTPIQISNADLSSDASEIPFSIPIRNNLLNNTYVISASLLEDGRICGKTYYRGDLITFGMSGCPRFNFKEGTSVTGISVFLNDFVIQNYGG
ncbi:MAG: hypothetical protein HQK54_04460 [Oligoflexales bacterium]|nr:hypothetical protein [Oligoflexales bacterium]